MWIISRLSFPLLYKVSDFLYYLLYYVFSYRKKVVRENLKLAFPKMNKVDIKNLVSEILLSVGLKPEDGEKFIHEFS